jgi:hypothetical protein
MHTDDEGVVHPLVLAPEVESADVHYASCETCGSRWAGPFKTPAMAAKVAQLANASAYYDLPARVRPAGSGLCHGPDGLPVGTPGAMLAEGPVPQHVQLGQAVGDVGKTLLFAATRAVALFVVGVVRLAIRLGVIGVITVFLITMTSLALLRAAGPNVPDVATLAPVLVGTLGVLVAVGLVVLLAQGLRGKLAEPVPAPVENIARTDYSTPLTTARGASSVSPVSKTDGGSDDGRNDPQHHKQGG